MFKDCNSLADLNAMRTQAVMAGEDLVTINNSYNKRRQEILAARNNIIHLTLHMIKVADSVPVRALPIIGASPQIGTIIVTEKGFLI